MDANIKVCNESDVQEGKLSSFTVESVPILVSKVGNKYYAVNDTCSHHGGDLSKGTLLYENTVVKCPWHGSEFNVETGKPVSGPHMTKVAILDKYAKVILPSLVNYAVSVKDNAIYIKGPVQKQAVRFAK